MKLIFAALLMFSFASMASPLVTTKERLRIHMWYYGIEDKPIKKKVSSTHLPEEIERALKKI